MDMETLGYFLYMEEVEKEQMQQDQAEYGKVNVRPRKTKIKRKNRFFP